MADANSGTPQPSAGGADATITAPVDAPLPEAPTTAAADTGADWRTAAFAAAPVGIVLFDFTGRVLDANPAFAELVERRASQAREMNLLDIVAPNFLQATNERLAAAAAGSCTSLSLEFRVQVSGGPVRHVAGEASVLPGRDGRPVGAMAHVRDVTAERRAADSLRRADEQLDAVSAGTTLVAFSFSPEGAVRTWSPAAARAFGWPVASVLGRAVPLTDYVDPWGGRREGFGGDEVATVDATGHRPDGSLFRCRLSLAPLLDEHGRRVATVAMMNDTGRRLPVEATPAPQDQPYRVLLHKMADTVTVLDAEGNLLYSTSEMKEILGYPAEFWDERSAFDLAHPEDLDQANALLRRVVDTPGLSQTGEFRARRADGRWEAIEFTGMNLLDDEEVGGIIVTTRSISDRRPVGLSSSDHDVLELGARLAHQVMHDPLTGLPNRALLVDRIDQALGRGPSAQQPSAAVLLVDLDRFKVINDGLGHQAGDELLVRVAVRLEQALADVGAVVGRFGGDQFVVVVDHPDGSAGAQAIAARLRAAMREPFTVERGEALLTASIGIALAGPGDDSDALLRNAAAAMYRAKDRGRDRAVVFDDELRVRLLDRLHFENDLRHAIDHGELTLSYQPTVSLESGRVIGVEALLRWTHPERGAVGPAEFVPVAEESGLIVPLGAWVLNEAIGQAADWLREVPGHPHFLLSVNLSPRQLNSPDLVPLLQGLLERHQWPADFLALELTENVLMDDVDTSMEVLHALKGLGVRLAIDDFGTGYSSLSYLERFPFDIVKIDQSFVNGLGSTGGGLAITAAVVLMARSLGLVTVAEGVETKGQSAVLQSLGCDWGQGYHFARPLPAAEAGALLHANV
ncbi:MAG: EAL domain-containing protein [Acidimicrobiales bacterium]|nr:EAL domain-containing protein [Acidimicrobiales bacterium]